MRGLDVSASDVRGPVASPWGQGPPPPVPAPGWDGQQREGPEPGRRPAAPRVRTHRWGLGAFLLVEAVFLLVSLLIFRFLIDPESPSVLGLGIALSVPSVMAAAVAVTATVVRGNGPKRDLGLVWSWRDFGIGLAFGVGGLFVTSVAAMIWVSIVGPDVNSAVGQAFGGQRASVPVALAIALLVVVFVPVCEEIVYRGLLWGAVEGLGVGRWVTFGVTTFVFALFHFEWERAPLLLVIAIPIGLARLFTGRLLAGVVAHQVNNFLPGVVLFLTMTGVITM